MRPNGSKWVILYIVVVRINVLGATTFVAKASGVNGL